MAKTIDEIMAEARNGLTGEKSEELYDKLIENGCDADLIALEGADHADLQFFQDELWERIIEFFKTKLG